MPSRLMAETPAGNSLKDLHKHIIDTLSINIAGGSRATMAHGERVMTLREPWGKIR